MLSFIRDMQIKTTMRCLPSSTKVPASQLNRTSVCEEEHLLAAPQQVTAIVQNPRFHYFGDTEQK